MQGHEVEQFKTFNTFIAIEVFKLFQNVIKFYNLSHDNPQITYHQ